MIQPQEQDYEPIFVGRQPIFDRSEKIWGFELLFRHSDSRNVAVVGDQDLATAKVIADGFTLAASGGRRNMRYLINFPQNLILNETPLALPMDMCVVEILESVIPDARLMTAVERLKMAGYIVAVDDFVGQDELKPLLHLADIVKIDVLNMKPIQVVRLAESFRDYKCDLLAEKVETKQMYDLTMSQGFKYFQGYYFSKPQIVEGRKVSSPKLSKIQLLSELSRDDFDMRRVVELFSGDLSLSYRLLKYINSALFSIPNKVDSIKQAVTLLGTRPLKQWLMVVMLSDLNPSPRATELTAQSVRRGRFLELLSKTVFNPPAQSESMFMLGLFSKLDALLDQQMSDILAEVPIDESLKSALLGEDTRLRPWIELCDSIDSGDWTKVTGIIQRIGASPQKTAKTNSQALIWAEQLLGESR